MGSIITLSIVQSALELGFIYALVALALFISFSILNIADLSTDGCFTLGCAVCASVTLAGHPVLGLLAAMAAGVCSGFVTAFLQTRLGIQSILAGIIVNTGLYTINIAVMGFASNLNLFACDSVFTWAKDAIGGTWYKLIVAAVIVALVGVLISLFLNTRLGLSIRATGDNPDMVRASSINTGMMITIGLCVANALTGLSGGLLNNAEACYAFMQEYPNVVPIWGIQREEELDQWLELTARDPHVTPEIQAVIDKDRKELAGNFCRSCGPAPLETTFPWRIGGIRCCVDPRISRT